MIDDELIKSVTQRVWFYPFELPDGTKVKCDLPDEIRQIHHTRARHLARIIADKVPGAGDLTALDLGSHEGYFSIELARSFGRVTGYEYRAESAEAARLITAAMAVGNIEYRNEAIQEIAVDEATKADFVLLFGVVYHMENPIDVLRRACALARRHIFIETQIFPYDVSGSIENGHYKSQRPVTGVFALTPDFPTEREGGSTEFALVPSLNGLLYLLNAFGFETEISAPLPGDYEQFQRGSRMMLYGRRRDASITQGPAGAPT